MRLVYKGHQALNTIAAEVSYREDVTLLINLLWANMTQHRGVGLAANQIGLLQRVIVVHTVAFKQAFINPIITKRYGGQTTSCEACLSFPELYNVPMVRSRQIIVEGFDENWEPVKRKLKGLAAMVVQHEVDHLNGVTIGDGR